MGDVIKFPEKKKKYVGPYDNFSEDDAEAWAQGLIEDLEEYLDELSISQVEDWRWDFFAGDFPYHDRAWKMVALKLLSHPKLDMLDKKFKLKLRFSIKKELLDNLKAPSLIENNLIGNLSPISNKTAYQDKKKKKLKITSKPTTEFQHHIRLVMDDKLETPWPAMFWKTVEEVGPDDILHPVQTYDEIGKSITVFLRHYQDYNGDHIYEVPLNRNLTEEEAEKIVFVWEQLYGEDMGDFVIETSTPYTGGQQRKSELFSRDQFEELAERIAKENHNNWMKRRVDSGWRYGLKFNRKEKTHPMIQPWEQLPEEYRNVDRKFPSFFADLLGDYGFGLYIKEK